MSNEYYATALSKAVNWFAWLNIVGGALLAVQSWRDTHALALSLTWLVGILGAAAVLLLLCQIADDVRSQIGGR